MLVQEGETKDQTFTLASMKIHERYDDVTFENDIAILKLNGVATRYVKSVDGSYCFNA